MMYNRKHGMSHTRFSNIWRNLRYRCSKPTHIEYKRYGARGISYDPRWDDMRMFIEDMYPSYLLHVEKFGEKNTSIDRIDNDKDYSKENCKWATPKEQSRNTRRNRTYEVDGVVKTLAELVEGNPLDYHTIKARLYRGWDINRALNSGKLVNQFSTQSLASKIPQ